MIRRGSAGDANAIQALSQLSYSPVLGELLPISQVRRKGKPKSFTDRRDLAHLLLKFPELKSSHGVVEQRLIAENAGEESLTFWQQLVAEEILKFRVLLDDEHRPLPFRGKPIDRRPAAQFGLDLPQRVVKLRRSLKALQRIEVLGHDADRTTFVAFEKRRVEVRERLRHRGNYHQNAMILSP